MVRAALLRPFDGRSPSNVPTSEREPTAPRRGRFRAEYVGGMTTVLTQMGASDPNRELITGAYPEVELIGLDGDPPAGLHVRRVLRRLHGVGRRSCAGSMRPASGGCSSRVPVSTRCRPRCSTVASSPAHAARARVRSRNGCWPRSSPAPSASRRCSSTNRRSTGTSRSRPSTAWRGARSASSASAASAPRSPSGRCRSGCT